MPRQSFEVAIVEDNKLVNFILTNELDSTINKIKALKNNPIKFSSFHNGSDFLMYLESHDFENSKLIVFSDFHLEKDMNGAKILKRIKQKGIDARVIIMSDTTNKQTSEDTVKMGAERFLHKDNRTPLVCSEILYQMVN